MGGPDSGRVKLIGPGYNVAAEFGAPVVAGGAYVLNGVVAGMVVEFSDRVLADHFVEDDTLELRVGGVSCTLRASDGRLFLSPMGRMSPWSSPFRILPAHTKIEFGTLHCGSPMPAPTPAPPSTSTTPLHTTSETSITSTTPTSTLIPTSAFPVTTTITATTTPMAATSSTAAIPAPIS